MKFSIIILTLTALMLSGCSSTAVSNSDGISSEEYNSYITEYDNSCPWGDAVIVDREDEFLSKLVTVSVDCVNYDPSTNNWVTWTGNLRGDKMYQKWDPKKYRVYTMEGEIIIENGSVKTVD